MGKMFRGKILAALKTYYDKKLLSFGVGFQNLPNYYNWKEFIDFLLQRIGSFIREILMETGTQ